MRQALLAAAFLLSGCGLLTAEIDIVWYDDRDDENRNVPPPWVDLYFTFSTNRGESFRPNRRISTASSATNTTFFGDYVGVDARAGVVHPIWTDSRTGQQDIMTTHFHKAVGGTFELSPASAGPPAQPADGSGPSLPYAAIAGGLAAAVAFAAGGCYGRRRWLR